MAFPVGIPVCKASACQPRYPGDCDRHLHTIRVVCDRHLRTTWVVCDCHPHTVWVVCDRHLHAIGVSVIIAWTVATTGHTQLMLSGRNRT